MKHVSCSLDVLKESLLDDAEAQICCYGMQANVLGVIITVISQTRARNATKEAAERVDCNQPRAISHGSASCVTDAVFLEGWEDRLGGFLT